MIVGISDRRVVASAQFIEDFELVAEHYKYRECGEYELAKQFARNDMKNAEIAYAESAAHIRYWNDIGPCPI